MHKSYAKRVLAHYIKMAARGDLQFDHESQAEIEEVVDCIIEAAAAEAVERIKAELSEDDQRAEDNATYNSIVAAGLPRHTR